MVDLYDVLEVSSKASTEVIQGAFKALSKKYHPEANATISNYYYDAKDDKIKQINYAYEILSDSNKRLEYDVSCTPKKIKKPDYIDDESLYSAFYENSIYSKSFQSVSDEDDTSIKGKIVYSSVETDKFKIEKYLYYFMGLMTVLSVISYLKDSAGAGDFLASNFINPDVFVWGILFAGFIIFGLKVFYQLLTDKSIEILRRALTVLNVAVWSFTLFSLVTIF